MVKLVTDAEAPESGAAVEPSTELGMSAFAGMLSVWTEV